MVHGSPSAMTRSDFLFAKAITEPLHAVILLITKYQLQYQLLNGAQYTLQTRTDGRFSMAYYSGRGLRSLSKSADRLGLEILGSAHL